MARDSWENEGECTDGWWCDSADAEQEAVSGMGGMAVHSCGDGSTAVDASGCVESDDEACNGRRLGEVAAGVFGCEVCESGRRRSDSADAEQEAVDGMGEVAVYCS